jgi:hypothetical protein
MVEPPASEQALGIEESVPVVVRPPACTHLDPRQVHPTGSASPSSWARLTQRMMSRAAEGSRLGGWLLTRERSPVMGRPSKYPPEFRAEAVELIKASGRPRAEIARSLGSRIPR